MPQDMKLDVNGVARTVSVEPGTPLLYVLRNDLELNAPRFGCGLSQCGACTVMVDGKATRSCVFPTNAAVGRKVTTLEGIGSNGKLHPLQRAFIAEQLNHPHPNPPPEGEGMFLSSAPRITLLPLQGEGRDGGGFEGKEVTEGNLGFPLFVYRPRAPARPFRGKVGMGGRLRRLATSFRRYSTLISSSFTAFL
jgi:hypothetical protein